MKPPTRNKAVNFCARWFLALVFLAAAFAKFGDLNRFAERVGDFGVVPDAAVLPAAWAIVLSELLVGLALVLHLRGGLISAVGLLLLFVGVLTYGIALGLDIECGCFGPAVHVSLRTQLLADWGLLLVCAIVYCSDHRRHRTHSRSNSPQNPDRNEPL